MVFIETTIFTRRIQELMPEEDYMELQHELILRPDAGAIIPKSGGIRKLRWHLEGGGKRGGCRIIYYWAVSDSQCYMLMAYGKNEQTDLTSQQLKMLRKTVKQEFER